MTSDDSTADYSHSVTRFIERIKHDDPEAAGQIWQRYFERLLPLARARLQSLPHRVIDEEDILVSVFDRFFRAAREDRFVRLEDRGDLWQILLLLTDRKASDEYRRAAAQKRRVQSDSGAGPRRAPTQELADDEPGPEFVAAFNDCLVGAVTRLGDDTVREVALLRMEGFTNREIAAHLNISVSSVERKRRVIRKLWKQDSQA